VYLTAVGDAVNVASRLQEFTKQFDCQLVMSAQGARRAGMDAGRFPRHQVMLRHHAEPLQIYAIMMWASYGVGLDEVWQRFAVRRSDASRRIVASANMGLWSLGIIPADKSIVQRCFAYSSVRVVCRPTLPFVPLCPSRQRGNFISFPTAEVC
jgi:hypothetical protein